MDEIRFGTIRRDDPAAGLVDAVAIIINGRDLVDIVREAELPLVGAVRAGAGLAGGYVGLPPGEVLLPARRMFGEPATYYDGDHPGRIAVLGYGCGDVGCWPLLARITPLQGSVVWSDFSQPHRPDWRYDGLGPLVFDRARYTAALAIGPRRG